MGVKQVKQVGVGGWGWRSTRVNATFYLIRESGFFVFGPGKRVMDQALVYFRFGNGLCYFCF